MIAVTSAAPFQKCVVPILGHTKSERRGRCSGQQPFHPMTHFAMAGSGSLPGVAHRDKPWAGPQALG